MDSDTRDIGVSFLARLLEHPQKVTRRIYDLGIRLNSTMVNPEPQTEREIIPEDRAHPLLAPSHSPPTYFPISHQSASNPWNDAATLMLHVRRVFHSGYISQSPFLKGHIAVLVGKSALATLSFGEVVRTGMRFRDRAIDGDGGGNVGEDEKENENENENAGRGDSANDRSPAAWALEMMNLVIPPLTFWNPKQASVHLMQGLFSVAYSTHTSESCKHPLSRIYPEFLNTISVSAICGIIGVITSCTKLMGHLRAVEAIAGIDEDRRRSMQVSQFDN
jgi:hypothetical protein